MDAGVTGALLLALVAVVAIQAALVWKLTTSMTSWSEAVQLDAVLSARKAREQAAAVVAQDHAVDPGPRLPGAPPGWSTAPVDVFTEKAS